MSGIIEVVKKSQEEEWYQRLCDACKTIIGEAVLTSRWALVEGYYNLGKRIKEDLPKLKKKYVTVDNALQALGVSLGKSKTSLYYAYQFVTKYPSLDDVPEIKNITWNKLITKYLPAPKEDVPELPEGKFSVVYADPPWPYNPHLDPQNLYGAVSSHYDTMSIKELCDMKVKDKLGENGVLFLWVATHFLEESFRLIEAWDFSYKSQMVWVKKNRKHPGIGYYVRGHHELLLIATKGSFLPKTKVYVASVVEADTREHSQKPDIFYDIIEKLYPDEKYLELFARNPKKREGWVYWGDQLGD